MRLPASYKVILVTLQCAYCPIVTGRLTGCIKKLISALKTLNLCTEKS